MQDEMENVVFLKVRMVELVGGFDNIFGFMYH